MKPLSEIQFCMPGAVHDVITHANFDEARRGKGSNFMLFC